MLLGRGIWTVLAAACVLAAAPAAEAGTVSKANGEYVYTDADSNNVVLLYYCAASECSTTDPGPYYIIRDAGDAVTHSTSDCQTWLTDTNFLKCTDTTVTAWRLSVGAGNDQVLPQETMTAFPVPLVIDGGADTDDLRGATQADSLTGGTGDDTLLGAGGDDVLDGGTGSDVLNGLAGIDTVTYAGRSTGVSVDLGVSGNENGSSEDGAAGSRDGIVDVENVIGGAGADELRGAAGPNRLEGGAGDDTLDARAGEDVVLGGSGVDNVQARDGEADSVDCGPDEDAATTDAIDTRVNCDPPAPSAPAGGGTTTTIVTNTVTLPSRVALDVSFSFVAGRRSTTLRELYAEVEPGARLTATCRTARRRRCPRVRALTRATAARSVRLRGFERRPLPVGAKIQLRLTKDGAIGVVKTLTIRRRRAPAVRTLCLPPGASRPAAC